MKAGEVAGGYRLLRFGEFRRLFLFPLLLQEVALHQDEFVFHAHIGDFLAVPRRLPSDVFCWCQIETLPLEAAVIDPNLVASLLEISIDDFRPGGAPRFDEAEVVPGTVLLAKSIGIDVSQRQQDVRVGVAPLGVVADVRDHAGRDEGFTDPLAQKFAMNGRAQRQGEGDLYLAGKLSVATVLDPVNRAPQRLAVFCPGWRDLRSQYL